MRKVALLIGVSEYESGLNPLLAAVRDVNEMQRVLEHPDLGGFAEADIKVLKNPQQLEMAMAIETLFSALHKDDLVLLYFSGHGIKDESNNLYLATRQTCKYANGQLVTATTVGASYIHKVMENSRSRRQVVILDCCFSGAFAEGMRVKDDGIVDIKTQLGGEGRAVLTSSTATQYSFEQQVSDLSIYTRYLVEGIETGLADINNDGVITVDELHEYAQTKVLEVAPSMKPGIFAIREGYKIQLAKAPILNQQQNQPTRNKIDLGEVKLKSTEQLEDSDGCANASGDRVTQNVSYLRNFLEPFKFFISKLITNLSLVNNSLTADEISDRILEIVRHSSEADFVFVLSNHTQDNWSVKSQSDFGEDIDQNDYVETLKSNILPTISPQSVFNPAYHGIYKIYEQQKDISKAFVIVPLQPSSCAEVMVVCGIRVDSYLLTDVYGRILSSFYEACKKLLLKPALIEAAIIDDLKRDFGFISSSLYDRRFQLFCERLRGMVVYFEPILHLDPVDLYISGWEALARDPDTKTAPVDLFEAAELWGPHFTIELDQYFLKVATQCYREERRKAKQNRPHEIVPLSVNVYPESLMRTAYFETVRQIIENKVISSRNLILEISEKTELPPSNDDTHLEYPLKVFEKRLLKYVRELNIRFGIDDFGVGYASVSRLAGLNPPYVKIDREILYHEPTEVIIRFVHELVQADSLRSTTDVIVEGIDENAPISLHRLKQIGVNYIQGYLVGKPRPEIYRLSQEKAEFLRQKLLEPTT